MINIQFWALILSLLLVPVKFHRHRLPPPPQHCVPPHPAQPAVAPAPTVASGGWTPAL